MRIDNIQLEGIGSGTGTVVSASFASTGSSINTLNQSVVVSGSFTVFTGSAVELQVTNTGVRLGNLQTDRHQVTGSLQVTGSITGSLFGTASFAMTASLMTARPQLLFRRTLTTGLPLTTDTLINWDITDVTNTISGLTHSAGVFTNTSARTLTVIVEFQGAARTTNTAINLVEHNLFITYNGTPTGANRIAETVTSPVNNWPSLQRLTTVLHLNPSDTFRCYQYVTAAGATTWIASGNEFGYDNNFSTRIKVTEI